MMIISKSLEIKIKQSRNSEPASTLESVSIRAPPEVCTPTLVGVFLVQ